MRIVPPIILDRVSVDLGPWSGYHVLTQYQVIISIVIISIFTPRWYTI